MKRLVLLAFAAVALGCGTANADPWGYNHYRNYNSRYLDSYHAELDHRAYERELAHREAHRYPMSRRQHRQLHDDLDRDAYHDYLEHRYYHKLNDPRYGSSRNGVRRYGQFYYVPRGGYRYGR